MGLAVGGRVAHMAHHHRPGTVVRAALALLAYMTGCAMISGPCTVGQATIVCAEGGQVLVFKPAHAIETGASAAASIKQAIVVDANKADPRQLVPSRARH